MNVFEVAKTLVDQVEKVYAQDIAIIAYYGSYAQGTATKRSDLDFFFIPASSKGYEASVQFIIDGISFDFWPISWERAERMASFEESQTSIIADCKLLYARSDEDRERFMKLRDMISSMQSSENKQRLVEKAESEIRNVYTHLYKLNRASDSETITFYRTEAYGVLTKILQSFALLNGKYYTKGFGKNKDQILQLPIQPARLAAYMETIMHSNVHAEIVEACDQLTADTLALIVAEREKYYGSPSYPDRLKGFYEEVKGLMDKIITACEMNDYDLAFFAANHVQDLVAAFLFHAETGQWPSDYVIDLSYQDFYKQAGFPDLVDLLHSHDLSPLREAAERLSVRLEDHLRAKGVSINRFEDIEQFEVFLKQRNGGFV